MHAIYAYNAGASRANVLSDITAILTGETNKANLSAACNQTKTSIISTIAAGWVVHDAAPATDAKVLKGVYSDDINSYKYAYLAITDTTLLTNICLSWDAGTHTGTKSTATTGPQPVDVSAGGTFHLYASARFFIIFGVTATYYGSSHTSGGFSGVFEISRAAPWLNSAGDYTKAVLVHASGQSASDGTLNFLGKVKLSSLADSSLVPAFLATVGSTTLGSSFSGNFSSGPGAKVRNHLNQLVLPTFPIFVLGSPTSNYNCVIGDISAVCDVWITQRGTVPDFVEYEVATKKYRTVPGGTSASGIAMFLVPSE